MRAITTRIASYLRIASIGGALAASAILAGCDDNLSGTFDQVDGAGRLEFHGSKVYVTSILGTTFVTNYEVDGNHIIIKGAGGAQVYTHTGDTLDAGAGIRFVKR